MVIPRISVVMTYLEFCTATIIHPDPIRINAPILAFNTRSTADLMIDKNFYITTSVGSTMLIATGRFTND
jgi:hypothetical protein